MVNNFIEQESKSWESLINFMTLITILSTKSIVMTKEIIEEIDVIHAEVKKDKNL